MKYQHCDFHSHFPSHSIYLLPLSPLPRAFQWKLFFIHTISGWNELKKICVCVCECECLRDVGEINHRSWVDSEYFLCAQMTKEEEEDMTKMISIYISYFSTILSSNPRYFNFVPARFQVPLRFSLFLVRKRWTRAAYFRDNFGKFMTVAMAIWR